MFTLCSETMHTIPIFAGTINEHFGIVPKVEQHPGATGHTSTLFPSFPTPPYSVKLSEMQAKLVKVDDVLQIIKKASYLQQIALALNTIFSGSPAFQYQFMPLMSRTSALIFPTGNQEENVDVPAKVLRDFVHGMKLKYVPIEGDGNCFFSSIAYTLIAHHKEIIDLCSDIYTSLDLTFSSDFHSYAHQKHKNLAHVDVLVVVVTRVIHYTVYRKKQSTLKLYDAHA